MADTIDILACPDCSDIDRIDPEKIGPRTSDPCDCGCGWWNLLCQVCGAVIGRATSAGKINLAEPC
jgi:hypothetical protein